MSEETNGYAATTNDDLSKANALLEKIANDPNLDVADRKDALAASTSLRRMLTRQQKAQIAKTRAELKAKTAKA
jgi:hypothetical protein